MKKELEEIRKTLGIIEKSPTPQTRSEIKKQEKNNKKILNEYDWFYQHSWLEYKYFFRKLNHKFILWFDRLHTKVIDKLSEKYLFIIQFQTNGKNRNGDDINNRIFLPLFIKANSHNHAIKVGNQIIDKLRYKYDISLYHFEVFDKITENEIYNEFAKNFKNINSVDYENEKKMKPGIFNSITFDVIPTTSFIFDYNCINVFTSKDIEKDIPLGMLSVMYSKICKKIDTSIY